MEDCKPVRVITSKPYSWSILRSDIGTFYYRGTLPSIVSSIGCVSIQNIRSHLEVETSPFSFILETSKSIIAAVDQYQSYPIFTKKSGLADIVFSNVARTLVQDCELVVPNWESVQQFMATGYVFGRKTLVKDVHRIGAELVVYDLERKMYESHPYETTDIGGYANFELETECKQKVVSEIADRLTEYSTGRPIRIPLGANSINRLIFEELKSRQYGDLEGYFQINASIKNVTGWESFSSKKRNLRIMCLSQQSILESYLESDRQFYAEFSDDLSTTPNYSRFFCIQRLINSHCWPVGSVVFDSFNWAFANNGNHSPTLDRAGNSDNLGREIVEQYCQNWIVSRDGNKSRWLEKSVRSLLEEFGQTGCSNELGVDDALGIWFFREYNPKVIMVNRKVFDYFGLDCVTLDRLVSKEVLSCLSPKNWHVGRKVSMVSGNSGSLYSRINFWIRSYLQVRKQLPVLNPAYIVQKYRESGTDWVTAFGSRLRLHELGLLAHQREDLPHIRLTSEERIR